MWVADYFSEPLDIAERCVSFCRWKNEGILSRERGWVKSYLAAKTVKVARLYNLEFCVLGDHFLQPVGDETHRQLQIVPGAFRAEDCAVAVLGVFHASAEGPGTGGLLLHIRFESRCLLAFPAA